MHYITLGYVIIRNLYFLLFYDICVLIICVINFVIGKVHYMGYSCMYEVGVRVMLGSGHWERL